MNRNTCPESHGTESKCFQSSAALVSCQCHCFAMSASIKRRTETNFPPEPHVVSEIEGVIGLKAIRPCGTVLQYSARLAKGFWNCRCMYMDVLRRGLRFLLVWLGFHKTEQQLQSWSVWKGSVGGRPTSTRSIRSSSMRKFGPLPFSLATSSNLHL